MILQRREQLWAISRQHFSGWEMDEPSGKGDLGKAPGDLLQLSITPNPLPFQELVALYIIDCSWIL